MAINKIEATLKGALKQAIIACGFVEEYDKKVLQLKFLKINHMGIIQLI